MDYMVHINVHVYAEEKLEDSVLTPHSKNYGIIGKEIISPLRKINRKDYLLKNVQNEYSVCELWDWIERKLYENVFTPDNVLNFVREYNIVEKYLVFNNLRYTVGDESKPLKIYLQKMGVLETDIVNLELLVCADSGTVFKDDGIRYYMHSKESGKHNVPHVHVDIRHEQTGSFSIIDGTQLSDGKIKRSDKKRIQEKIKCKKKELLLYWNNHTDGLTVDLNQALGLIHY